MERIFVAELLRNIYFWQMLDYELLDFGQGRKLERFGKIILDRTEVLATGAPLLSAKEWNKLAHGRFEEDRNAKGNWVFKGEVPESWPCHYRGDGPGNWTVLCKTGPYKHIGIFPEQQAHWKFLSRELTEGQRYLNLFAYTGAASLVAARVGADVFHVEASKSVVNWAAINAKESKLSGLHWVCDDALKFAEREIARGRRYHGISMDPPVFGRSKGGVRWKLEDKLFDLMGAAAQLLHPGGFVVLNTYSPTISLDDMVTICKKTDLSNNEGGWLSVNTADGRELRLSKYLIAGIKKPRHFR